MSTRQIAPPWERVYDIHGVRVALRTDSAAVAEGAEQALADFARRGIRAAAEQHRADPSVRMELHDAPGPAPVPPGAQPQFRHAQVRCYRHRGELWYTSAFSTVVLDPDRGTAEGNVTPGGSRGGWRLLDDAVVTFSLLELLRHRGLYHLHAAGLARDEHGVLLAGDTGVGKSTLTVTLVRSGWDFLSDDALLLRSRLGGVEALAIPDEFHLDPALAQTFPELAILRQKESYNGGTKRAVELGEVYERGPVPACVPSLLFFPQIAPGPTRAEALAPTQALAALIRTSALVLLDERVAALHLEALRRLVSQCRCYRLYHGSDALEDPECVPRLMEALF
jgi:hypothetical protein